MVSTEENTTGANHMKESKKLVLKYILNELPLIIKLIKY